MADFTGLELGAHLLFKNKRRPTTHAEQDNLMRRHGFGSRQRPYAKVKSVFVHDLKIAERTKNGMRLCGTDKATKLRIKQVREMTRYARRAIARDPRTRSRRNDR